MWGHGALRLYHLNIEFSTIFTNVSPSLSFQDKINNSASIKFFGNEGVSKDNFVLIKLNSNEMYKPQNSY